MSDNIRRFRSIRNGLIKLLPCKPTGNFARHFETMALMINGVIASHSCQLPKVACKVANLRKQESRVRSFGRWLNNESIDFALYYLPFADMEPVREAAYWYKKRFIIETFFSDQKGRGFHLHKSHISEPERIEKLMMVSSLAYIWIIFLGALAIEKGWYQHIHRTDRCDLSLFQLGLRLLDYRLNLAKNIPIQLNLFAEFAKSVQVVNAIIRGLMQCNFIFLSSKMRFGSYTISSTKRTNACMRR